MPWWFWTLLWLFLLAATALFLVLCGIRLFRGFMRLLDEAGEAADRLHLGEAAPLTAPEDPDRPEPGLAAVFGDPQEARRFRDAGKAERREARRRRRVEAKVRRGQPQRVRDLDLP
jgi:hypothetical protein